jgi:hypothetical protein
MKSTYFVSLTACLQFALSFSAISYVSASKSPTIVTTSGQLVGVDDGAGGMYFIDKLNGYDDIIVWWFSDFI